MIRAMLGVSCPCSSGDTVWAGVLSFCACRSGFRKSHSTMCAPSHAVVSLSANPISPPCGRRSPTRPRLPQQDSSWRPSYGQPGIGRSRVSMKWGAGRGRDL